MILATCLFASTTLLSAGPQPAPAAEPIAYQVRIVEVDGLSWRVRLGDHLARVGRNGPAMLWTADRATLPELTRDPHHAVHAPKAFAPPGETVNLAHDGLCLEISGRTLDQGVLAIVDASDTWVTTVHEIAPPESKGRETSAPGKATESLPEVHNARVEGEWLIPADGILVASLGVHTVADKDGKAVVRERLLLLEAGLVPADATALEPADARPAENRRRADLDDPVVEASPTGREMRSVGRADCPFTGLLKWKAALPMPSVPGRSLPTALAPDGSPATLPPLPDEEVKAASDDESAEPRPSPQARPAPAANGAGCVDDQARTASAECPVAAGAKAGGNAGARETGPTFTFPLPFLGPSATMQVRVTARRGPAGSPR